MRFKHLPWVGQRTDLNPIENARAALKQRLRRREEAAKTQADLFGALQEEWRAIPEAYFQNLADSMVRRCVAVLRSKGFCHQLLVNTPIDFAVFRYLPPRVGRAQNRGNTSGPALYAVQSCRCIKLLPAKR